MRLTLKVWPGPASSRAPPLLRAPPLQTCALQKPVASFPTSPRTSCFPIPFLRPLPALPVACLPTGVKDLTLLKTTQSGYEGFLRDQYTVLPEVNDRIMASTVTCTWKYTAQPPCYDAAYAAAKQGLLDAFLGPARGGVYSPSVQYTLYNMAK